MNVCSLEGCENNSSCENISLFSFPKTKERDEWIKFAKKGKWLPKLNSKICSEHFSKKRRLQAGAVPQNCYTQVIRLSIGVNNLMRFQPYFNTPWQTT
jgi:hypothetical protein